MNRRVAAEQRGRGAERIAAWWLRLRGWRILAQRARVPGGEVDTTLVEACLQELTALRQRAHHML